MKPAAPTIDSGGRRWMWPHGIAAAALLLLTAAAILSPKAVAQGWLVAFVLCSGMAIGSLTLMLIHGLTGGRWGDVLAPVLKPLAATLPMLTLAFIPIAIAMPIIFPWVGQSVEPASLGRFYLNTPSFLIRAALALLGFSLLTFLVVADRCSKLVAGLGLAFYGLMINLISVDWILSVHPGFGSSAFGSEMAIQQLLSALAIVAVVGPEPSGDVVADDLGGLLIATILGVLYIGLMTFIVSWYGDLPPKAAWYLARSEHGWALVIGVAVGAGALLPLALLLRKSVRYSRRWLRLVGLLALIGVTLHIAWLMGPALAPYALAAAALALIALIALSIGVADLVFAAAARMARHV